MGALRGATNLRFLNLYYLGSPGAPKEEVIAHQSCGRTTPVLEAPERLTKEWLGGTPESIFRP